MPDTDFIFCILFFAVVGVIDDFLTLKPVPKLILQSVAGVAAALIIQPTSLEAGITIVIWLVVITNAFNFIDGLDGLAISFACIIFIWSLVAHGPDLVTFTLLGASLGFLPFNIYRAKFYLGDSGSHALGAAIGYLTIPFVNPEFQLVDLAVVSIPLADVFFVLVTRAIRGVSIMTGNTDHSIHRLARVVGAVNVVVITAGLTIVFAGISLLARSSSVIVQSYLLAAVWFDMIFFLAMLERRTRQHFA